MVYFIFLPFAFFQFAADFAEKALFKSLMVRLLKLSDDDGTNSMADLLTEEFLNVDNQLLEIVKSTMDMSGQCLFQNISPDVYNFLYNSTCILGFFQVIYSFYLSRN